MLSGVTDGDFAVVEATATACTDTKQKVQVDFLQSEADDWPMFMHDGRHQGYSRFYDNTTTENLTLVWSEPIGTANTVRYPPWGEHPSGDMSTWIFPHPYIDSSPVHASGYPVIVGGWDSGSYTDASTTGYVKAFDPTTGADAWRYPAGSTQFIGGVASTPCVAEIGGVKRVYIGSMDGKVYCLNATTGAFVWSYQTTASGLENANYEFEPARVLASPVVYNGRVYIGNESATVYCLNATTGALVWPEPVQLQRDNYWPDRTGVSSAAIGPTAAGEMRAYVGCDNGHVYCLSLADSPSQRVIWEYPGEQEGGLGCIESSPTVYAGNVYVGASSFQGVDVIALNASTGNYLWHQGLEEEARATCAIADGTVLVGVDTGSTFHGLDWETGGNRPLTNNPFDASLHRPPSSQNDPYIPNYFVGSAAISSCGTAYVGNDNHALYPLTFSTFNLATSSNYGYDLGGLTCSSPAISYAVDTNPSTSHQNRWVYVVTRQNGGTIVAYRQNR